MADQQLGLCEFFAGKYYEVRKGRLKEVTVDPEMTTWWFGSVIDPRSREIQNWNRLFLISCAISSAVDPLFLYLFAINKQLTCIFVDTHLATPVTVMRLLTDAIQFMHMYIQLRLAYVSKSSLVQGRGELVFDARKVCKHYFVGAFWIDLYVFMPMPPVSPVPMLNFFHNSLIVVRVEHNIWCLEGHPSSAHA